MKVTVDVKKGVMLIELPLISPPVPSKSGKTLIIATTNGNKESDAVVNDQNIIVGCNAYIYPSPKPQK